MGKTWAKPLELVGYAVVVALTLVVVGLIRLNGPAWAVDAAIAVAFAIAIPTMVMALGRRWRGD